MIKPPTTPLDPTCEDCARGNHEVPHGEPCGCSCHEQLLYPSKVLTYNVQDGGKGPDEDPVEVDYFLYKDAVANKRVGDVVRHDLAAPGYGYRKYRITRIDERGVWAVLVEDRSILLTEAMVL